jgi:Uma2 family endonuclease
MAMPRSSYFTADDVRALPDDGMRYETVHGELLVTPAPGGWHQPVVGDLHGILYLYLNANGLRRQLLSSPADISYGPDTLVQPDTFVADTASFLRSRKWTDVTTLHLVIEVLSPSSLQADRVTKRRLYQEVRIPEYWIVDIDQRHVEVWTLDAHFPVIERERLTWHHPALDDECAIDLVKAFDFG